MTDPAKHLLLVDDEAALRQAVAEQLTDRGYQVAQAGSGEEAVGRLAEFAFDFVNKPFQFEELRHVLDAALERRRLKSENAYLRAQLDAKYRFEGLIGKSA